MRQLIHVTAYPETMGRFRRSWELGKSSWSVIRSEPRLVLLPVISFLVILVVMGTFASGIFFAGGGSEAFDKIGDDSSVQSSINIGGWVMLAVGYLVAAYVVIFFNSALIWAANEHFEGRDVSLRTALGAAFKNAFKILPWAIISATVSFLLKLAQEKLDFVGDIIAGVAGLAWSVITFLVLPAIVVEGLGPKDAIKRSSKLFKKTWGENMIGNGAVGLITLVGVLIGLPLLAVLFTDSTPLIAAGIALLVIWWSLVAAVTSAMSVVYQMALFRYAAEGNTAAEFESVGLDKAFKPKKARAVA